MPGGKTARIQGRIGVHKIGLWCNKSGHLSAKTPHFGKNQGEVSKKNCAEWRFSVHLSFSAGIDRAAGVQAKKMLARRHPAALTGSEGPRQPFPPTLPAAPDGAGKRPQAPARLPHRLTQNGSGRAIREG